MLNNSQRQEKLEGFFKFKGTQDEDGFKGSSCEDCFEQVRDEEDWDAGMFTAVTYCV